MNITGRSKTGQCLKLKWLYIWVCVCVCVCVSLSIWCDFINTQRRSNMKEMLLVFYTEGTMGTQLIYASQEKQTHQFSEIHWHQLREEVDDPKGSDTLLGLMEDLAESLIHQVPVLYIYIAGNPYITNPPTSSNRGWIWEQNFIEYSNDWSSII